MRENLEILNLEKNSKLRGQIFFSCILWEMELAKWKMKIWENGEFGSIELLQILLKAVHPFSMKQFKMKSLNIAFRSLLQYWYRRKNSSFISWKVEWRTFMEWLLPRFPLRMARTYINWKKPSQHLNVNTFNDHKLCRLEYDQNHVSPLLKVHPPDGSLFSWSISIII